jgi:peroxiredoxin
MSADHGQGWVQMLPQGEFELPAELERWRKMRDSEVPADAVARMDRANEELDRSRATDHVVRPGDLAPKFTLPNAVGAEISLDALLEKGPVVISFYRGTWCPFCNLEQRALQQHLPRITELGASLVAISGMTPDNSLTMVERLHLTYEVLTDNGLAVARSYGLVFELPDYLQEAYEQLGHPLTRFNGTTDQTLPMPGTFVVDKGGYIRFAYANENYMHRADPLKVIGALEGLD